MGGNPGLEITTGSTVIGYVVGGGGNDLDAGVLERWRGLDRPRLFLCGYLYVIGGLQDDVIYLIIDCNYWCSTSFRSPWVWGWMWQAVPL